MNSKQEELQRTVSMLLLEFQALRPADLESLDGPTLIKLEAMARRCSQLPCWREGGRWREGGGGVEGASRREAIQLVSHSL